VLACTLTGATLGVDGYLVRVEVDLTNGIPAFHTVGLPDAAVRESRERVRSALRNCGFKFPEGRITINLAPADVRKEGSALDLAVAVGLMAANGEVGPGKLDGTLLLGELALDGTLRPVPGVLAVAVEARSHGVSTLVVPAANRGEAALVRELSVLGAGSLREVVDWLASDRPPPRSCPDRAPPPPGDAPDLADVKGQQRAKRALEVAAAGGHNLLFCGPPGAGKTLLARRLPSLLPELDFEEALEVTRIYSVAGKLSESGLIRQPPFRAPHHTVSWAAMAGGGPGPRPGEVSLAHRGVLFLDELAELNRSALEALRQPLEEGSILLSRARRSIRLPARFTLVAAMNPCPCGYFGAERRRCECTPAMVARYRSRVSGPLLDRIDLQVYVQALSPEELFRSASGESSQTVRESVLRARALQRRRFASSPPRTNAQMSPKEIRRHCRLETAGESVLRQAAERLGLSARGFDRVLKVSRTIADLERSAVIETVHLHEAIQYRAFDAEALSGGGPSR